MGWIPVRDKQHYPLMGIHPVFFQNTMELFFLVGFVAYLHWSSVLVVLYCIAESLVITLFNAYKAQKSFVFSQRKKQSLIIFSLVLGSIFIAFQFLVLGHLYPQRITLQAISSLIWNDNEFLLCLLAIVLQQAIEYYKHSKTAMVFSEDLFLHHFFL